MQKEAPVDLSEYAQLWKESIEKIQWNVFDVRRQLSKPQPNPDDESARRPIPEEHEGGLIRFEAALLEAVGCLREILDQPTREEGTPNP